MGYHSCGNLPATSGLARTEVLARVNGSLDLIHEQNPLRLIKLRGLRFAVVTTRWTIKRRSQTSKAYATHWAETRSTLNGLGVVHDKQRHRSQACCSTTDGLHGSKVLTRCRRARSYHDFRDNKAQNSAKSIDIGAQLSPPSCTR